MGCAQASSKGVALPEKVAVIVEKRSFFDEYEIGEKLGAGAFGQVRVARVLGVDEDDDSAVYAAKVIDMRQSKQDLNSKTDEYLRRDTKVEARIWRMVTDTNCQHLIRLHEVFWDSACCFFVMERCEHTLLKMLEHATLLDERFLGQIFHQMVIAVEVLHRIKVSHRDIKPDNFLCVSNVIKLGDFGLSALLPECGTLSEVSGTAPFMSPEMLKDRLYGLKTDVWSLGALMYVMVYGQFPYNPKDKSTAAMKAVIREGAVPPSFTVCKKVNSNHPHSASPALESLLRSMLDRDPMHRLSAAEVLKDGYWVMLKDRNSNIESISLRPHFTAAVRCGAFTLPKHSKQECTSNPTDVFLSELSHRASGLSSAITGLPSDASMLSSSHNRVQQGLVPSRTGSLVTGTGSDASLGSSTHGQQLRGTQSQKQPTKDGRYGTPTVSTTVNGLGTASQSQAHASNHHLLSGTGSATPTGINSSPPQALFLEKAPAVAVVDFEF